MFSVLLAIIYLAFISLGLPDALLGSAWPIMHREIGVPLSWSGIVFMIISVGTIVSSLLSDRLTRRLGAGKGKGLARLPAEGAVHGKPEAQRPGAHRLGDAFGAQSPHLAQADEA